MLNNFYLKQFFDIIHIVRISRTLCTLVHLQGASSGWFSSWFWLAACPLLQIHSRAFYQEFYYSFTVIRKRVYFLWPRYNFPLQTAGSASCPMVCDFQIRPLLQHRETCSVPCRFPCVSSPFGVTPMQPLVRPYSGLRQSVWSTHFLICPSASVVQGVIIRI